MISLDAISTLLSINQSQLIEDLAIALLASPQLVLFFEKFPGMKKSLLRDLPRWKTEISESLKNKPVPEALKQEFRLFQQYQTFSLVSFTRALPLLLTKLNQLGSPFAEQAHALAEHCDDQSLSPAQHTLFLQRWRLSLTLQTMTQNEQLLKEQRENLLAALQQRMELSGQLAPLLSENDESSAGGLWDMSAAPLQRGDYQLIVEYGTFLAGQPELMKLAQQLGRSRETKATLTEVTPPEGFHQLVRQPDSVPEEVSGLHQSDDVLRLLPTELATLGISELEIEFYRRLVEKRMLTYHLRGDAVRDKVVQRSVSHQQQQVCPQGPFIVCVDTSGSMGGFNERCAKAFCLALLRLALAEKRSCYIMLFAHEVIGYELTAEDGIAQAIRFLSQRFRGGTDLAGCLEAVLQRLQDAAGRDADVVIVSDFIAQRLPESIINAVRQQQQRQQQRFHAVAMSSHGKPGILRIFDYIWRFDTGLKQRLLRRWKR